MIVKPLNTIHFPTLIQVFLKAFDGYFVKMPNDENYYKQRWQTAKVDYNLSYGMFDQEQLVGFIINAVDTIENRKIAYNTGTGVIPSYRGKKVIDKIYEFAKTDLKNKSFTHCTLEVITKNIAAIKVYKRIGFTINDTMYCFGGSFLLNSYEKVILKKVDFNNLPWLRIKNQELYCWDYRKEIIKNSNYDCYLIVKNNQPESYFIIHPETKAIAQFDLLTKEASWNRLFSGIHQISDTIKINNVNEKQKDKLNFLQRIKLPNPINQYQMELAL